MSFLRKRIAAAQMLRSLDEKAHNQDKDDNSVRTRTDSGSYTPTSAPRLSSCSSLFGRSFFRSLEPFDGNKVAKVQFKHEFRYFQIPDMEIQIGEFVIVHPYNHHCEDLGVVVETYEPEVAVMLMDIDEFKTGKILRVASLAERRNLPLKLEREFCLLMSCQRYVSCHLLPMDIYDVEFQFDEKVLFVYYTSKHRVDCHSLVKFLLSLYCNTRIEMKKTATAKDFVPLQFASYRLSTGNYFNEANSRTLRCL